MIGVGRRKSSKVSMAQVLTKSGRYATVETIRRGRGAVTYTAALVGVMGIMQAWGLARSLLGHSGTGWVNAATLALLAGCAWVAWRHTTRSPQAVRQTCAAVPSLKEGRTVAGQLAAFPDSFRLIHGYSCDSGAFDHVVIGPSGVFLLETKNWRGTVSADGAGELLWDGKELEEPEVRHFMARVMETRTRLRVLIPDLDPYLQAVFVFTAARLEAPLGTTRTVHCIRDEQLWPYLSKLKQGEALRATEIERIADAFLNLAGGPGAPARQEDPRPGG